MPDPSALAAWNARPAPVGSPRWRFPPPGEFPEDDIVGFGADLEPDTLIGAYRSGIFPMPIEIPEPRLAWWSPDPRGILPLDELRVTRSLKQSVKRYQVRVDTCFVDVIGQCANLERPSGWISQAFIDAYTKLHELGWAHSVEAFDREGTLAGGLYGVRINGLFAGESMFQVQRDASKVALVALVDLMRESRMTLLDVQWRTDHLASLGVIDVSRATYLARLAAAVE
jgi:leucyl/phenylalanyl-tRNA--protein transferase